MLGEILDKIRKSNEQRLKMACTLVNVMKQSEGATLELRTAVAASLLEMLQYDMLTEDKDLVKILDEAIDYVCTEARETRGVEDLRSNLVEMVERARKMIDEINKKEERVNVGEDILKTINFN